MATDIVTSYRDPERPRTHGWVWGFLLGWIGVIVVALLSDKRPVHRASFSAHARA